MDNVEERFAVIFNYYGTLGTMKIDCVALVDYNKETGEFYIKHGKYEGLDGNHFHKLYGAQNFINGNNEEMKLEIIGPFINRTIYIFSPSFINKLSALNNHNGYLATYVDIAKKICNIDFEMNEVETPSERKMRAINIFNPTVNHEYFSTERVSFMLYGNYISKDKADLKINTTDKGNEKIIDKDKIVNPKINSQELDNSIKKIKSTLNSLLFSEEIEDKLIEYLKNKAIAEERKKNIDINAIIRDISEKIVGQDEAIKSLVTNIYFNQVLIDRLNRRGIIDDAALLDSTKVSILLDGSTGTGKTAIAKEIASKFDLPIVMVSANSFSETGYVGPTITDILRKLLEQTNGDVSKAEKGIVFLDEIDKLATNRSLSGRDMKRGVQEELLAFIGGGKYDIGIGNRLIGETIQFDTSKLTFILSGAFTALRDRKIKEKEEKRKGGIGFSVNSDNNDDDRTYTINAQDYIDEGLMREFFGRVKVLTSTKTYTVDDLKNILLYSSISPLENFERTVQMFGYNGIMYSEEFINRFAGMAYDMATGARALQTIMSGIQDMLLLSIINGEFDKDKPIELTVNLLDKYKGREVRSY